MVVTDREARRKKILEAIIDSYVETALPIGSNTVSNRYRLGLSPATIRNVMSDLEELGLITHPHTSAGRVPTDDGYRYYVDSLVEIRPLSTQEEQRIEMRFQLKRRATEEVLESASKVLSALTDYTGIVLFPDLGENLFKHLELIPIAKKKVLAVLVTTTGVVRDSIIEFREEVKEEELREISGFLNKEFEGVTLDKIKEHIAIRLQSKKVSSALRPWWAVGIAQSPLFVGKYIKLYLEGTCRVLEQPEFKDYQKMRLILKAFEEKRGLLEIMREDLIEEGVKVHIGKENRFEEIKYCSLVVSSYKIGDRTVGTLGIIGPTRMRYSKVIPVVDYIAKALSRLLTRLSE